MPDGYKLRSALVARNKVSDLAAEFAKQHSTLNSTVQAAVRKPTSRGRKRERSTCTSSDQRNRRSGGRVGGAAAGGKASFPNRERKQGEGESVVRHPGRRTYRSFSPRNAFQSTIARRFRRSRNNPSVRRDEGALAGKIYPIETTVFGTVPANSRLQL